MFDANLNSKIPKHQRIFVNRSLNFEKIALIGFDMDHTLAPYRKETFEALAFSQTLIKFLEAGYPEELSKLQYKPGFVMRGLMVDRERGNILKANGHKYVKTAFHGYQKLSKEERYLLYNQQSYKAQDFLTLDTFFALSEVQLFLEIVDFMDHHPNMIEKSYGEVYKDLRRFIDDCHRDGSIKEKVVSDPERYIIRDKYLATTLVRLLDAGKSLFLLTNSDFAYTDQIMQFILNGAHDDFKNWRDYWDLIIVGANKPAFFQGSQPFFEVIGDSDLLKPHEGPFRPTGIYHGGNAQLLESLTGYMGDEILYIGDHVYGDIMLSKGSKNWRTLLIVEEIEDEIRMLDKLKPELSRIHKAFEEKEKQDEVVQKLRSKIAAIRRHAQIANKQGNEKRLIHLNQQISELEALLEPAKSTLQNIEQSIKDAISDFEGKIHPIWGQTMKVGLERSRFAHQVASYACLYTAKVTNLRLYSPNKRFVSFHEILPHEE